MHTRQEKVVLCCFIINTAVCLGLPDWLSKIVMKRAKLLQLLNSKLNDFPSRLFWLILKQKRIIKVPNNQTSDFGKPTYVPINRI